MSNYYVIRRLRRRSDNLLHQIARGDALLTEASEEILTEDGAVITHEDAET